MRSRGGGYFGRALGVPPPRSAPLRPPHAYPWRAAARTAENAAADALGRSAFGTATTPGTETALGGTTADGGSTSFGSASFGSARFGSARSADGVKPAQDAALPGADVRTARIAATGGSEPRLGAPETGVEPLRGEAPSPPARRRAPPEPFAAATEQRSFGEQIARRASPASEAGAFGEPRDASAAPYRSAVGTAIANDVLPAGRADASRVIAAEPDRPQSEAAMNDRPARGAEEPRIVPRAAAEVRYAAPARGAPESASALDAVRDARGEAFAPRPLRARASGFAEDAAAARAHDSGAQRPVITIGSIDVHVTQAAPPPAPVVVTRAAAPAAATGSLARGYGSAFGFRQQ